MPCHVNAGFSHYNLSWSALTVRLEGVSQGDSAKYYWSFGDSTWGDGRLFVLGTEGYIELRKYINVAVAKSGNNLFIVDQKQARYMDCSNLTLPSG